MSVAVLRLTVLEIVRSTLDDVMALLLAMTIAAAVLLVVTGSGLAWVMVTVLFSGPVADGLTINLSNIIPNLLCAGDIFQVICDVVWLVIAGHSLLW